MTRRGAAGEHRSGVQPSRCAGWLSCLRRAQALAIAGLGDALAGTGRHQVHAHSVGRSLIGGDDPHLRAAAAQDGGLQRLGGAKGGAHRAERRRRVDGQVAGRVEAQHPGAAATVAASRLVGLHTPPSTYSRPPIAPGETRWGSRRRRPPPRRPARRGTRARRTPPAGRWRGRPAHPQPSVEAGAAALELAPRPRGPACGSPRGAASSASAGAPPSRRRRGRPAAAPRWPSGRAQPPLCAARTASAGRPCPGRARAAASRPQPDRPARGAGRPRPSPAGAGSSRGVGRARRAERPAAGRRRAGLGHRFAPARAARAGVARAQRGGHDRAGRRADQALGAPEVDPARVLDTGEQGGHPRLAQDAAGGEHEHVGLGEGCEDTASRVAARPASGPRPAPRGRSRAGLYVIAYKRMVIPVHHATLDTDPAAPAAPGPRAALDPAVIGARVRALRERPRACRCATSPSAAGSAPRCSRRSSAGETSPTLAVAARIAAGLELRLSQLLRLDEEGR